MEDKPVDYERLVVDNPHKIGGATWRSRSKERKAYSLDETMVFQGSCYVMSRKHWDWLGGLQTEGYGEFAQEAVEIALKTWLGGNKVMVNKDVWYAHKHRKFGRALAPSGVKAGNAYSRDFWLNDMWFSRTRNLVWLLRRFNVEPKRISKTLQEPKI